MIGWILYVILFPAFLIFLFVSNNKDKNFVKENEHLFIQQQEKYSKFIKDFEWEYPERKLIYSLGKEEKYLVKKDNKLSFVIIPTKPKDPKDIHSHDDELKKELENYNPKVTTLETINIDDIIYWSKSGNISTYTTTSGGGVSIPGAVAGAVIAGAPGAIIGGTKKTETEVRRIDNRKIIIQTKDYECKYDTFYNEIRSFLERVIPDKEYERQQALTFAKTQQKSVSINADDDNINEILKYKKLLDNGIITQEEFDSKRKQLLGI